MSIKKHCPYCHQEVDAEDFSRHCSYHERVRADGQQEDYISLPPSMRSERRLDSVPQAYQHVRCGGVTGMPEKIVRSYLVDPYLYLSDKTFCATCCVHVPNKECTWIETGENLQAYMDRLRASKPEMRPGLIGRLLVLLIHRKWI